MRVASRRLRSALKTFDPLFQGEAHVGLEDGLKRLAEVLGARRDAEVLLGRMREALDALPPELVRACSTFRCRRGTRTQSVTSPRSVPATSKEKKEQQLASRSARSRR